jgi:hypothetical protein
MIARAIVGISAQTLSRSTSVLFCNASGFVNPRAVSPFQVAARATVQPNDMKAVRCIHAGVVRYQSLGLIPLM